MGAIGTLLGIEMRKKHQQPPAEPKPVVKLYSSVTIRQVLMEQYEWNFVMVKDLIMQFEKRERERREQGV